MSRFIFVLGAVALSACVPVESVTVVEPAPAPAPAPAQTGGFTAPAPAAAADPAATFQPPTVVDPSDDPLAPAGAVAPSLGASPAANVPTGGDATGGGSCEEVLGNDGIPVLICS